MAAPFDRRTLIAGGLAAATAATSARAQTAAQTAAARAAAARYGAPAAPPAETPDGPSAYDPPAYRPAERREPVPASSDPRYAEDASYDARRRAELAAPAAPGEALYPTHTPAETYNRNEIIAGASNVLGVTAEAVGGAIERTFKDNGQPTGYIAGEEIGGAIGGGLRYGKGVLYMKNRPPQKVYWQGPSIGFDLGLNGSRAFTLVYNLQYGDAIYRRFPGVEGSAYVIGGLGVNYQRADAITVAPIRAGVGLRLGANVGYLAYSRQRNWLPF